jgi:predicted DNA-binding transcriptional regulator AlpA
VCREIGVTVRTLNSWIAGGRFPAPTSDLFGRRIWPASVVSEWKQRALAGVFSQPRHPFRTPEAA